MELKCAMGSFQFSVKPIAFHFIHSISFHFLFHFVLWDIKLCFFISLYINQLNKKLTLDHIMKLMFPTLLKMK